MGTFRDYADFTTWLGGTVSRGVARKAKDTRWGLYLSDAKNPAEDVAFQREAAEKRRIGGEIERERRQAEARAAVAELDQPRPWLQAFGKIQYRVHSAGRDIPPSLKARLKRTGELISPNDLAQQIFAWQRCAQRGQVQAVNEDGSAIENEEPRWHATPPDRETRVGITPQEAKRRKLEEIMDMPAGSTRTPTPPARGAESWRQLVCLQRFRLARRRADDTNRVRAPRGPATCDAPTHGRARQDGNRRRRIFQKIAPAG